MERTHGHPRPPPEQQRRGSPRHAPGPHGRRAESRRRAVPRRAEPVRHQPAALPRRRHEGARSADAGIGRAVPGDPAGDPASRVDGRGARRHRGNLGHDPAAVRGAVRRADAGVVQRRRAVGLRHGGVGDGTVLLPARPEGLHRHVVLRRPVAALRRAGRFRAGLRDRARGGPSRAEPGRHGREGRTAASSA